jgi:hypothetical protein
MSREVAAEPGMSYEAVLEAVQESSRGRWFLNEFKSRNAGLDSSQILSAIARLESRMESLSSQGGGDAADELARVRQAIATTRKDILKASGAPGLSEEGKLFAHLAELARKSLAQGSAMGGTTPGSEALPGSIVQVLRLVDQIDGSLNAGKPLETPYADNFFQRDKDLLQPEITKAAQPVPAKPTLVPPAAPPPAIAKPTVEPSLGAKLVINRSKPPEAAKAPEKVPEKASAAPMPAAPAEQKPAEAQADSSTPARSRIVIIRHKPEEMPALDDDTALPTENAA